MEGKMREIKFRAWDKKKKRWWDDFQLYQNGAWVVYDDDDGGKSGLWEHNISDKFDLEIMQFTGLRDSNGKEIYEGDVVNVRNWGRTNEVLHIASIIWDNQIAGWDLEPFFDIYEYDRFRNIEVIGNIYETPELLRKE
jgi:uncharacterized phage protein (TIGR01671 family)